MKANKIVSRALIFLYLVIPYLPLFGEIDRIASQWFFLSLLNLISLPIVYYNIPKNDFFKIFRFKPILILCVFITISIFSMVDTINIVESSVEFFRHSSVLLAIINFTQLLSLSRKNLHFLLILLTCFCCVELFGLIAQSIQGLPLIGFTGNKNIASASLIIKSNFLLYLIFRYNNPFVKVLVTFILITIYSIIFIIGSKAGLVSLVLISLILIVIVLYDRNLYKLGLISLFGIFFSFIISSQFNKNIYITIDNTINYANDEGSTDRIRYFNQAFDAFLNNPINGVGIGNWKIYSNFYDSKYMRNYVVQYHTHNDYLQFFAEIGFGAISYLLFILFIIFMTLKIIVYGNNYYSKINKQYSLIILLGISIYFLDSNLNFPSARVIMQLNLIILISFLYRVFNDTMKS